MDRWISSVSSFAVFAGSLSAGRYFDSHGSFTLTMTGTILSVSSLVAIAFCKEYYQFMLAHLLFGMSGSFIYSPATAVSGHWFLRKRSTAVGIVVCGSGLGGVIYPIALRRLFDQVGTSSLSIGGENSDGRIPKYVINHCWDERRSHGTLLFLYESSSPTQDTTSLEELETTMAGSKICLPSYRILFEYDDVRLPSPYHADIQSTITILQCPPLYNLQQHLPHNHILLCRIRPSWLIHRTGRFWIHGGCVRRMERIHRFRSIPNYYSTRFLDGSTITRRSSRHWNLHIRDREWSLVSARSS
jgi:hypothetical protein